MAGYLLLLTDGFPHVMTMRDTEIDKLSPKYSDSSLSGNDNTAGSIGFVEPKTSARLLAEAIGAEKIGFRFIRLKNMVDNVSNGLEVIPFCNHSGLQSMTGAQLAACAKQNNLQVSYSKMLLLQVLKLIESSQIEGRSHTRLTLGLDTDLLENFGFLLFIESAIMKSSINPRYLQLMFCNMGLDSGVQRKCDSLLRLQRLGISLAVQQRSSASRSVQLLSSFPIDSIKVSNVFASNLAEAEQDVLARELLEMAIAHGLELSMEVRL